MVEGGTIHLLGAVRAVQGDEECVLAGTQSRLVLALLVLERGRPLSADELTQQLWPAGASRHGDGALRGVVSKVRAFLSIHGPTVTIENLGHTYRFVCGDELAVDVHRAERDLAAAEELTARGRAGDAAPAARSAVELLSEPLLAGDSGPWIEQQREELGIRLRRALRVASLAESALGHHDRAMALAGAARDADPCDEEGHRALMVAHRAASDRAGALRAYAECRRVLAGELGVSPSAETESLHLSLLGEQIVGDEERTSRRRAGPFGPRKGLAVMTDRPFVGRRHQLAVIGHAWERAQAGRRQIVLIHGEPGVGKTRVALEAVKRIVPPNLLYGRCSAEAAMPFEPLTEALDRHVALLDDEDLAALIGPFERELSGLVTGIGARLGGTSRRRVDGDDRPRSFAAVRAAFAHIAVVPTVLVIDDLHWADASTLLLIRHVLRTLDQGRLLVIGTYRDDGEPSVALAEAITELHRLDGCHTLPVAGLELADIVDLLRAGCLAGADELGPALAARTGGNPFYLTEVLAAAADDPEAFDPSRVPETVSNLVRQRVASLSPDARSVLAVAAVLGSTMATSTLERTVIGAGGRVEAVDELLDRHLLLELETGRYSFAHAIARDAVYGQLPRSRRRQLHLGAARATSEEGGRDPDSAWAVAHHYRAADDPAHAVELLEATVSAADHAMAVLAYERASDLYEQAAGHVARFSLIDPRTAAVYVGLGAARRRTGDFEGAREALTVGADLARSSGQPEVFAEAVLELVAKAGRGVAVDLPDLDRADLLQEAVDRLAGVDAPALLVSLFAELALALLLTDQVERRRTAAERALELARSGDPDLSVRAVVAQRLLAMTPDRAADRLAHTDALLTSPGVSMSAEQLARLHMWRIADCFELGDRAGVDRELAGLTERSDELGQPYWQWQAATWRALHTFMAGDPERADRQASEALQILSAVHHPEAALAYGIQLVGFRLQEGRGSEVVDLLRMVVEDNPHVPAMRCGLTFALAQAGAHDEARVLLRDLAADGFAAIPEDANWSVSMTCLAETACELAEVELAERLAVRLEPHREQFVVVTGFGAGGACWGPFAGVLGTLAACVGDHDRARRDFDQAIEALDRFGAPRLVQRIVEARRSTLPP